MKNRLEKFVKFDISEKEHKEKSIQYFFGQNIFISLGYRERLLFWQGMIPYYLNNWIFTIQMHSFVLFESYIYIIYILYSLFR